MSEERTEGWGVIRPGDRKAHYYDGMTALCGKVGFYQGPMEPDTGKSPDDCTPCRRLLDRRVKGQARDAK